MTRKHFELIARALASALENAPTRDQREGVRRAAYEIAEALQTTNANFDHDRFLAATKVTNAEAN